ncbi:hypothetical protein OROGR_026705 [Orobanche gracilis]
MRTNLVEAKLDEGNIQEAESALPDGLSLNFEEARALLGKLEYQRGNVEGALRVFDGIDLQAAIQGMQHSLGDKQPSKKEAAEECRSVLDAVENIFSDGIPDVLVENKLQETVSHAVELLPELLKQAGHYSEAMSAYRRAILSQWNLGNDCCARIQKAFAVFLLYSGVEVGPPTLAAEVDGSYVPKNNLDEAILLLMILMRKFYLDLLRKSLNEHEDPNDIMSLLLAASLCSENVLFAAEGVKYAQNAIANAHGPDAHLKGAGLRMLGLCLGKQAKMSSSDFERSRLQSEALKLLDTLRYAKQYLDATGGSMIKGWRLLALVLSAQQRFSEAEVVTDAALDETSKWDQGPLLRMKAKLKVSQSLHKDAIETYHL